MESIAWVLSIGIALYVGYSYRNIKDAIRDIQAQLRFKLDKKKTPIEEEKSTIIDPYDIVQEAKRDHEALMRRINGE